MSLGTNLMLLAGVGCVAVCAYVPEDNVTRCILAVIGIVAIYGAGYLDSTDAWLRDFEKRKP